MRDNPREDLLDQRRSGTARHASNPVHRDFTPAGFWRPQAILK
jgi:hypothetical protein